jgi:hypothetical protein
MSDKNTTRHPYHKVIGGHSGETRGHYILRGSKSTKTKNSLRGSLSAQNLCTDCPFHTFLAGPLFPENFHIFLLFSHRSSSESSGSRFESHTDFCVITQKSVWRRAVTHIFL